ncbi:hypothetical protein BH23PLA1_BH23PLA1_29700 [soil metagenome]
MRKLSPSQVSLASGRARALGDPTRLRILESLARGEQSVGHIATTTRTLQSTVSKHLRVLFQAGLVDRRREANTVFYWVADPRLLAYVRYLGVQQLSSTSGRQTRRPRV